MRPLYIFDLDGTIALIEHRRHLVEGKSKKWDDFFEACVDDTPNQAVVNTLKRLHSAGAEIWIFSGRSESVRGKTEDWLYNHDIWRLLSRLQMRPEKDYTSDEILKETWLSNMVSTDTERLVAVFDDRDNVVKMWRENGVACFQVAPGGF